MPAELLQTPTKLTTVCNSELQTPTKLTTVCNSELQTVRDIQKKLKEMDTKLQKLIAMSRKSRKILPIIQENASNLK